MNPTRAQDVCSAPSRTLLESRYAVRWGTEAFGPEELAAQLPGSDVVLTSWGTPTLTRELLTGADRPRVIAHAAGSVKNLVDPAMLGEGLVVFSAASRIAWSVGEYCLAATLTLLRRLPQFDQGIRTGGWKQPAFRGSELSGRTVGIVGASSTARAFMSLLQPFGVDLVVYDPYLSLEQATSRGVRLGTLEDVAGADVVSVHVLNIPETTAMFTAELMAQMPDGAVLINSSRGAAIDNAALHREVISGRLLAALDVFDSEPPSLATELLAAPNVLLTPHLAGDTIEGHQALAGHVMADVGEWFTTGRRGRCFVDPALWPVAA